MRAFGGAIGWLGHRGDIHVQKPILYLDIVGTLMLDKGGRLELAPFAREFVRKAKFMFDLRFLTLLEEHHALTVARALGCEIPYLPFPRALGKASSIDFSREFFWIDADPSPADLLRLSDERASHRLLPISRREGITPATLVRLLELAAESQGAEA